MSMIYFGLWMGCMPALYIGTSYICEDLVARLMLLTWVWLAGLVWLMTYGMNIVWFEPPEAVGDYDDALERGMVLKFDPLKRKAQ